MSRPKLLKRLSWAFIEPDEDFLDMPFHASWFAAPMATGALALLGNAFPFANAVFSWIAFGCWILACFILLALLIGFGVRMLRSVARKVRSPAERTWAAALFYNTEEPLFCGAIPISFLICLSSAVAVFAPKIGTAYAAATAAFIGWCISVSLAVLVMFSSVWFRFKAQGVNPTLTPAWMFVFATAMVGSSSSGYVVLLHGLSDSQALCVFLTGWALFIIGVFFLFALTAQVFVQLAQQSRIKRIDAYWVALGPPAVAGIASLRLGDAFPELLGPPRLLLGTEVAVLQLANIGGGLGLFLGFLMWALGIWWLFTLLFLSSRFLLSGPKRAQVLESFHSGMWAFVFPTASMGLLSSLIFQHIGLRFFAYATAILGAMASLMWLAVAIGITVVFVPRFLFALLPTSLRPVVARQEAQG
jgi:tellurite resistance protein TehA-like permease